MRFRVMKKLGLKTFELSQAYPLFWDKYERANWFFENIIATAREPLASREVAYLLDAPMGDGGQWDMFRAIVKKYGVVPKEAMPETYASSHTAHMNGYLTRWLRAGAKQLRELLAQGGTAEEAEAKKAELLEGVYRILAICLGEPPKTFEVRIRNDKNELKAHGTYTPQAFFAEFVGMELDDYVSLISAPTADKPFMRSYTVKFLGNVREAGGVRYANLPIASLKHHLVLYALCVRSMQEWEPSFLDSAWGYRICDIETDESCTHALTLAHYKENLARYDTKLSAYFAHMGAKLAFINPQASLLPQLQRIFHS